MRLFAFLALIAAVTMAAQCSEPTETEQKACLDAGGQWVQSYVTKLGDKVSVWRCLEKVPDSDWGGGLGK